MALLKHSLVVALCIALMTLAHSDDAETTASAFEPPHKFASLLEGITKGDLPAVRALISKGINPKRLLGFEAFVFKVGEKKNEHVLEYLRSQKLLEISDLQLAVLSDDVPRSKLILEKIDKSERSSVQFHNGWEAPLRLAIRRNNHEMVEMLLGLGADVNQSLAFAGGSFVEDDPTPLKEAIGLGDEQMVSLLVRQGARLEDPGTSFEPVDGISLTPEEIHKELYLGIPLEALQTALLDGQLQKNAQYQKNAKALIETGKIRQIAAPGANKHCPLAKAIHSGRKAIVKTLLDAGADPNVSLGGIERPIHVAVKSGHVEIVQALIEAGANVNTLDSMGYSPLSFALEGKGDIAAILRAAGAKDVGLKSE